VAILRCVSFVLNRRPIGFNNKQDYDNKNNAIETYVIFPSFLYSRRITAFAEFSPVSSFSGLQKAFLETKSPQPYSQN